MRNFNMMKAGLFLLGMNFMHGNAQISYYVPNHYHGLFHGQLSSSRSTAMGMTTLTQSGIDNAFYNPAAIGLRGGNTSVHLNYASGSHVRKGGQYPFLGFSTRIKNKLFLGLSSFHWFDEKDSPWTTVIGGFNEYAGRQSQSVHSLYAAYQISNGLTAGLSGNFLQERAVEGELTDTDFLLAAGITYEREIDGFLPEKLKNQRLRLAASMFNLLMRNRTEQTYQEHLNYRDLPIHHSYGLSYHFNLDVKASPLKGKYFEGSSQQLNVSVHTQFRDVLRGPADTEVNQNHEHNTAIGLGLECEIWERLAVRAGYYFEERPNGPKANGSGTWVTDDKSGLTWGLGTSIPSHTLSNGKLPFNARLDLVVQPLLNEYGRNFTPPSYFTDRNLLFSLGLGLQWVD